uniref:Putative secreted protein n=1 Tax=Anopheles marajoara TaxID=58244 RepID=A0A2M4C783_9DIPT
MRLCLLAPLAPCVARSSNPLGVEWQILHHCPIIIIITRRRRCDYLFETIVGVTSPSSSLYYLRVCCRGGLLSVVCLPGWRLEGESHPIDKSTISSVCPSPSPSLDQHRHHPRKELPYSL